MAKASATITLFHVVDIKETHRYYLLQSSTATAPSKPTAYPPGGSWVTTEPSYTEGSTNSLYLVDCTVYNDGSFDYTPVSKSSSYEAAKAAYNKAVNAQNTANNPPNKYATCGTAAATAAKVATLGSGSKSFKAGDTISVKFTNGNTATNPTLNVDSTGAKAIYTNGVRYAYWVAGQTVVFTYDGTNWQVASTPVYANTVTVGNSGGQNVYIDSDSVDIRKGTNVLSSFKSDGIYLGASNISNTNSLAYLRNEGDATSGVDMMSMYTEHMMKFGAKGGIYHNLFVDNTYTYSEAHMSMDTWDPLSGAFGSAATSPSIKMDVTYGAYDPGRLDMYSSYFDLSGAVAKLQATTHDHSGGGEKRSYILTHSGDLSAALTPSYLTEGSYGKAKGIRLYSDYGAIELISSSGINAYGDVKLNNALTVTEGIRSNGTLHVTGSATFKDALSVDKHTTLYDTLTVGGATSLNDSLSVNGEFTVSNVSRFKNHLYIPNGKMIYTYDSNGNEAVLVHANSSNRAVFGHGFYNNGVGETYIYSNNACRVVTKSGGLMVNGANVALQTWTTATITAQSTVTNTAWKCEYNNSLDLGSIVGSFDYTPTADVSSGTLITFGTIASAARPDTATALSVYTASTNSRRWVIAINGSGQIVGRPNSTLTKGTSYGIHIAGVYRLSL